MIINRYKLEINEDGYIIGFYTTLGDEFDYEGQMANFPFATRGWTKLVNGQLVEDLAKKAEILEKEATDLEISDLEEKLNSTDYIIARTFEDIMALDNSVTFIVDFIKIIRQFREKYKDALANRKTWRERIEELRGD